jgi:hypothetical protein
LFVGILLAGFGSIGQSGIGRNINCKTGNVIGGLGRGSSALNNSTSARKRFVDFPVRQKLMRIARPPELSEDNGAAPANVRQLRKGRARRAYHSCQ